MQKRYVRTAIFDLDGTLIDSLKDIVFSLNYTLKTLGLEEKSFEAVRGYIGLGRGRFISDALGHVASQEMIDRTNDIFGEHYQKHMFDSTRLYSGVLEILDYLKDKTMMILTNKNRDLTLETLKRFNIEKYFKKVVGGDDFNCRKPAGCPIINLINEIKVPKNEAIMIGDSDIDVKSGNLAGIITCGLSYGIGKKEDVEKANPDYMLDDIRKLKDIIY